VKIFSNQEKNVYFKSYS